MKKLYILDAVNFLFRSYFAIGPMTNPQGESTGALYGFIRSVYKIMKECQTDYLIAVFDGPESTKSRKKIYSEYKAHRDGMPDDLYPQLQWALEFCDIAGIPFVSIPGIEADDVIGSIALWSDKKKIETYLCSSDKDLAQLVTQHVFILNIHKDNLLMDRKKVKETFNVFPEQIIDLLAMMGDTSDNIPGLPGVGPKTAANLLNTYGTLDAVLANTSQLKGKLRSVFEEGREIVLLSKQLATIETDIDFPKEETFFRLKEPAIEKIRDFYHKMHFMTLLKELGQAAEKPATKSPITSPKKVEYILINDQPSLFKLISELSKCKELCIDTETSDLDPLRAKLVGVGLTNRSGRGWYIPFNGEIERATIITSLKPLLENPSIRFFGHNIKYDLHILNRLKLTIRQISFDTMIASYLLAPHKQRHGLDLLSLEHFGKVKTPISDLIGKGAKERSIEDAPLEKVADYCSQDVDYTFRLKEYFSPQIKEAGLKELMEKVEMPLISVLMRMEERGVFVDKKELEKIGRELKKEIEHLTLEIYDLAKVKFNLNSPKQLGQILFEKLEIKPAKKTKTGYSTSANVLNTLIDAHPIIGKILKYRGIEKLRSTYADALPFQINPDTGRIHCSYNQSVTATGRLSSQDPNLQNIPIRTPEGGKIRSAFKPEKQGWSFVSGDYSQIELRLLAHLSEDPTLIQAFQEGEDIHTFTASLVYNVSIKKVTKEMRYAAKAVNFGILYGQSAFGLSKEIGISIEEAKSFIKTYFARYKKVEDYLDFCKQSARDKGYSLTLLGRKRPIPEIESKNFFIREAAERLAVNAPLQGTAADLIKIAMIELDEFLENKEAKMILQIHDELIFETPDSEITSLSKMVKKHMEGVFQLKIPLVAHISVGKNWGEC